MHETINIVAVLKGQLAALKTQKRIERRKADWSNRGEHIAYNRAMRQQVRRLRLDVLVPDRKCPVCKVVKVKSRSWVVREIAVCLACWRKHDFAKGL